VLKDNLDDKRKMKDFLDVDKPIPGQSFVCLSFISPEKTLQRKDLFFFAEFVKEKYCGGDGDCKKIIEQFEDFMVTQQKPLEEEFHKLNNFQTTVRGLKVRGVYSSENEAQARAKELQKFDPSFHVYVGSVGYWLPWDPTPDAIKDQIYQEEALNQMMAQYKENEVLRDVHYQKQKEEMKLKAIEENLQRKKKNEEEMSASVATSVMEGGGSSHAKVKSDFEKDRLELEALKKELD